MKLNSFVISSTTILSNMPNRSTYFGNANNSSGMFSTSSLLPPKQGGQSLQRQYVTMSVEEYKANAETLRKQAILEAAAAAPIKIGKNSDGTIWTEKMNSPEEALEKMRETGGEKDINWKRVEGNLKWHGAVGTDTLDAVGQTIDYLASEYVQYKTRIEQQYTGEEQIAELEKLDQLFTKYTKEAAEQFSEKVGGFLEENGVSGEQAAIYDSFLDIYEQRKTTYSAFVNDNSDYAEVMGTEDEWLLTSGDFMGKQLRYALISEQAEMKGTSEHGYSIDELSAAGTLVKELTAIQDPSRSNNRSEEEMGVELGMAAMKYALLSDHYNLGDDMKSKLDKAFDGFVDNEIEKIITHIEQQRNDPFVRDKAAYEKDYDKQAVLDIVKKMVANLKADDINAAFQSNFDAFTTMYKEKMLTTHSARYKDYQVSWSNQNHVSEWNQFVQQLSNSGNQNLNGYLLEENPQRFNITV